MKKTIPSFSNKEILIALCNSLSEKQAKEAYTMLTQYFNIKRVHFKRFNKLMEEDSKGMIRLRAFDYDKLIKIFGLPMCKNIFQIWGNYLEYLEQHKEQESSFKRKLREYYTHNHYRFMVQDWVIQKAETLSEGNSSPYNKGIDFFDINNIKEAREYIKTIPSALRINNSEIDFLVTAYPELLKEIENNEL